jgi:uncharacterized protein (DUF1330 family)
MTYYAMGEVTVIDREWVGEYLANINGFIEKHGGRVLSRSLKMERTEGERPLPTNVILIEFPSRDAALAFYEDPDYQPLRAKRRAGSNSEFLIFPGEDLARKA